MGLAASQARFLGLTARKSNVEYKVQQINQQRTALSNEVMGLYTEYNKLDVPVPPSINDFNNTVYKLDTAGEDYRISGFAKILAGNYAGYYNIGLTYDDKEPAVSPLAIQSCSVEITKEQDPSDPTKWNIKTLTLGNIGKYSYTYDPDVQNPSLVKITGDYDKEPGLEFLREKGELSGDVFYKFILNDMAYYASEDDIKGLSYTTGDKYCGPFTFYGAGTKTVPKGMNAIAALSQSASGAYSSAQIIQCDDDPTLVGHSYNIVSTTEENQSAYQDAMNQYNYKKALYEKEVTRINNKTESLQKEDRSLELQINELDTEQKALATEMDSVTKVIEDTVEAVFKTFNG